MSEADGTGEQLTCQWCAATAPVGTTSCPACGAALAQRESIGDLVIPGLTNVDPALAALDGQPLHIPKASPSQGMAGGAVMAAAIGGPVGLAALGGLAAVAATEYLLAGREAEKARLEALGKPDELALRVLEQLDAASQGDPAGAGGAGAAALDPWRDVRMSDGEGAPPPDHADDVRRRSHPDEDERPTE